MSGQELEILRAEASYARQRYDLYREGLWIAADQRVPYAGAGGRAEGAEERLRKALQQARQAGGPEHVDERTESSTERPAGP